MLELADMSVLQYPSSDEGKGPTPCFAVVYQLGAGKTTRARAKPYFIGAMQHKSPLLYTIGSIAQYLFARWHIAGEQPPCFQQQEDQYNTVLLVGKNPQQEALYNTQYKAINSAFAQAGISLLQKTYAIRGYRACAAKLHSISESQVSLLSFYFN